MAKSAEMEQKAQEWADRVKRQQEERQSETSIEDTAPLEKKQVEGDNEQPIDMEEISIKVEEETVPSPVAQTPSKPVAAAQMVQKVLVQEEITDFDELD